MKNKTYFFIFYSIAQNTSKQKGEFDWDSQEQGVILGSYLYGNIATQIIGGLLAEKFGGKWVFASGVLLGAVASLFTPLAARAGMGWLIFVRVILGMGQVRSNITVVQHSR